jgi:peptide-methionine (S)-S-oxide reductase
MRGVQRCLVGYSGGGEENPSYAEMKDYTESVFVEFDQSQVSYETILQKWKSMSTPYEQAKRQYRTAVFYLNEEQEKIARFICKDMEGVDVEPVTKFFMAEERHQNFLARL